MLRTVVAGVTITSLNSCTLSTKKVRYQGLRPGASSPVIEQAASWSEEAVEYFERRGEFNG